MASTNVEELVAVANQHGFKFTPADMVRHQAQTILSFSDAELELYSGSARLLFFLVGNGVRSKRLNANDRLMTVAPPSL